MGVKGNSTIISQIFFFLLLNKFFIVIKGAVPEKVGVANSKKI